MQTTSLIKNKPKVFLLILFMLLFINAAYAKAEQITFICEGNVRGVNDRLTDYFNVGDLFRLEYTIDTETPDYNYRDPDKGYYQDAVIKISIKIGDYVASRKGGHSIIKVVNNDSDGADIYELSLRDPLIGEPVNYCYFPSTLTLPIKLYDPSGKALEDDSLITSIDLSNFSSCYMGIHFEKRRPCMPGDYDGVYADVNSVTVKHSDPVCQSDIEGEDGDMDGADLAVLAMDSSSAIIEDFAHSFGGSVCMKSPSVWHGYWFVIDSTDIERLKNYTRITDDLYIYDLSDITDLRGFANLQKIDGDLEIGNNTSLSSLTGLENIASVESLNISNNDVLPTLHGLEGLKTIKNVCIVSANDNLTSLSGLENLPSINQLYLLNNDSLSEMPLNSLCRLKAIIARSNPSLCEKEIYRLIEQVQSCSESGEFRTIDIGQNKICE